MSLKAEVEEGWEMQQQSDSPTSKLVICFAGGGDCHHFYLQSFREVNVCSNKCSQREKQ